MISIIKESIQDISDYLISEELLNNIINEFGSNYYNNIEVIPYIVDLVIDKFNNNYDITSERVIICKVDEDVDLIDTDHPVINYNGYYYDFLAYQFKDAFSTLTKINIPVIQPIIHSEHQITERLSSVKNYVILGY